jgi:hypothetical protein
MASLPDQYCLASDIDGRGFVSARPKAWFWSSEGCHARLTPDMRPQLQSSAFLQADETTVPVQICNYKGKNYLVFL